MAKFITSHSQAQRWSDRPKRPARTAWGFSDFHRKLYSCGLGMECALQAKNGRRKYAHQMPLKGRLKGHQFCSLIKRFDKLFCWSQCKTNLVLQEVEEVLSAKECHNGRLSSWNIRQYRHYLQTVSPNRIELSGTHGTLHFLMGKSTCWVNSIPPARESPKPELPIERKLKLH